MLIFGQLFQSHQSPPFYWSHLWEQGFLLLPPPTPRSTTGSEIEAEQTVKGPQQLLWPTSLHISWALQRMGVGTESYTAKSKINR